MFSTHCWIYYHYNIWFQFEVRIKSQMFISFLISTPTFFKELIAIAFFHFKSIDRNKDLWKPKSHGDENAVNKETQQSVNIAIESLNVATTIQYFNGKEVKYSIHMAY